uniref:Protein SCO2 homolog, mitochondrial n=1 Tax=Geotrypetes seraphini TaxID=260995 RepID=A0A6P8S5L5_GEOSA|nr:protein SCO2 homolog, mitochondrial [Geotrypetes seraphini]XP_033813570.1 protein SCO2 homolog, mitochondrial [Geotrypetes seraphini]
MFRTAQTLYHRWLSLYPSQYSKASTVLWSSWQFPKGNFTSKESIMDKGPGGCLILQRGQRGFKTTACKDLRVPEWTLWRNRIWKTFSAGPGRHLSLSSSLNNQSTKPSSGTLLKLQSRILVVGLIAGMVLAGVMYMQWEKNRKHKLQRMQQLKQLAVGQGDFNLVDQTGKPRCKKDFFGHWVLLYFGFTHCPDICPDELEKITEVVHLLDQDSSVPQVLPVFVTVDPERDDVAAVAKYVKDFHPRLLGLTGSPEQVRDAGKAYRVYYSTGPKDDDDDYIVDHTVIVYLLNPDGLFTDYYTRSKTAPQIAASMKKHMQTYRSLFS